MRKRKPGPPEGGGPVMRSRGAAGFGLIEVLLAAAVLSTAMLALLSVSTHSIRLDSVNRETAIASAAARTYYEELRAVPLMQVFARFNADPKDDPMGEGTARGAAFLVPAAEAGLDLDGRITFPVSPSGELREDLDLPGLGMPRDLNGDGKIDGLDHRDDYVILPVIIDLSWSGASGPRDFRLMGVLLP